MERKQPELYSGVPDVAIGEPLGTGSGTISAHGFELSEARELADTIVTKHLVGVADTAPCCCIDGRSCVHSSASSTEKPAVGPSLAGGALVTAYAAAELVPDYFASNDPQTIGERIDAVHTTLTTSAVETIVIGAHTVVDAQPGATGCGASDKFTQILKKPTTDTTFVNGTVAVLLGEETVNEQAMAFTPQSELEQRIKDYSSETVLNKIADENTEVLTGKHAEVLVIFNYNQGTTVDRDALVAETGQQVFVVDMWYIDKLSRAMASGRPDAVEMETKLRHAMTAFQVATYLTLCDGSHRPVLLKPQTVGVPANL